MGLPPLLSIQREGGGHLYLQCERDGDRMATFPFALGMANFSILSKRQGGGDGVATSPFYLKRGW